MMVTNATSASLGVPVLIRYALMFEELPPPASDIAALTSRMARGDEEAFRAFHAAYFPRLLRYLFVVTHGDEEIVHEALQSTLVRVARHVRRFDSEAVFWSWLTVLSRSAVVDEQRKRQRRVALLYQFFQRQQIDNQPTDHEADASLRVLLEQGLGDLTAEERALMERKYFEEESVRDIAASLNTTEGAVESRLMRTRRRLKDIILARLKDETTHEN
ncbi:MAG: sigma-70 family RNA polymerase sigma factor [Verrucomicrobiia bacterium]